MNELVNISKTLSILFTIILYGCSWQWVIEHKKDCNRNARWEVLVSRAFIGLHIGALIVWFIWSWKH